jgi:hypothetical protein
LQTKLEKLTAQKNAIEQKKQALLIERLTVEMEMNQEKVVILEAIIEMSTGVIKRKGSELEMLNSRIKEVHNLKLGYEDEIAASNKKITRIANSKDSKREKDSQTKKAKKALDIAKSKEQDVDSLLNVILKKREISTNKIQHLLGLYSQGPEAEAWKEAAKALKLEKIYQEIAGNTENTLSDIVQEKIAIFLVFHSQCLELWLLHLIHFLNGVLFL